MPSVASRGRRVKLRGECFTDRYWQSLDPGEGYGIALIATVDANGTPVTRESRIRCELIAHGRDWFHVHEDGRLRGWFVVPQRGACFQQDQGMPLRDGRYGVIVACHTCDLGTIEVRGSRRS